MVREAWLRASYSQTWLLQQKSYLLVWLRDMLEVRWSISRVRLPSKGNRSLIDSQHRLESIEMSKLQKPRIQNRWMHAHDMLPLQQRLVLDLPHGNQWLQRSLQSWQHLWLRRDDADPWEPLAMDLPFDYLASSLTLYNRRQSVIQSGKAKPIMLRLGLWR